MADAVVEVASAAPYAVTIGRDLTDDVVSAAEGASTVAVIHPTALEHRAGTVASALRDRGRRVITLAVPDAESAKDLSVLHGLWGAFGRAGMDRSSMVVGLGGGTVTDLAGFAAATWMRGIPVVQVPTTLLAMVDAAVGGKTGINTDAGKNMVGAFHEPRAVIADLAALDTLPAGEMTAGMAEVVKTGFIADPEILRIIEDDPEATTDPASPQIAELITRSVSVKARVVSSDLKESGLREILNYGHTLAHAIEKREHYRWRHGHAVAVGLVYVAELARLAGRLDDATADRHTSVLRLLGLPTGYDPAAFDELVTLMHADKKVRRGILRFVVLDGLARPGRLEDPSRAMLGQAYAVLCRDR